MRIIIGLLSGLIGTSSLAGNTSNIKVAANAQSGCIVSANDVSFGSISEINRKKHTELTVQVAELGFESELVIDVKCSKNKAYTINGAPMENSAEFPGRYGQYMLGANTGKILQYGLWHKSGVNIGSWFSTGASFGGFSSKNIAAIGTGDVQNYKIFVGLYSPQENAKNYFELIPDSYSDNYTITVNY